MNRGVGSPHWRTTAGRTRGSAASASASWSARSCAAMRRRRYAAGRADTGTHSETERETERETHVADTLLNEGFVTTKKIEESFVRVGPNISSEDHCEKFISANLKRSELMWINEENKIQSLQKRKYSDVILFLNNLLKTNLKNSGVPKGLEKDFKKGVKVVPANKVSNKSINEAIRNIAVTDETIFS